MSLHSVVILNIEFDLKFKIIVFLWRRVGVNDPFVISFVITTTRPVNKIRHKLNNLIDCHNKL